MNADQRTQPKSWLAQLASFYTKAGFILACTLMLIIVAVMGVQVFCRYVLNDSLIWAEEVCGYLLLLMTFLLIGIAFEKGQMVTLRFITNLLPLRIRIALFIPSFMVMILFLVILGYYGVKFAQVSANYQIPAVDFIVAELFGKNSNFRLSMFWLYLTISAGCFILSGHFLATLWRMVGVAFGRGTPPSFVSGEYLCATDEGPLPGADTPNPRRDA